MSDSFINIFLLVIAAIYVRMISRAAIPRNSRYNRSRNWYEIQRQSLSHLLTAIMLLVSELSGASRHIVNLLYILVYTGPAREFLSHCFFRKSTSRTRKYAVVISSSRQPEINNAPPLEPHVFTVFLYTFMFYLKLPPFYTDTTLEPSKPTGKLIVVSNRGRK